MPAYFVLSLYESHHKFDSDTTLRIIPVRRDDGTCYFECYGMRNRMNHRQYAYTYEESKIDNMTRMIEVTFGNFKKEMIVQCHSVYFGEDEPLDYSIVSSRICDHNEIWSYEIHDSLHNSHINSLLNMLLN